MLLTYCLSVPTMATLIVEYFRLSCEPVSEIDTLNLFLIRSFNDLITLRLSFKDRELTIITSIFKVPMIMQRYFYTQKQCDDREDMVACLEYDKNAFTYLACVQLDELRRIL